MYKDTSSVEAIIFAKQRIAVGRDLLSDLLRYLKNELSILERTATVKRKEPTDEKIANYKKLIDLASQSISTTYDIVKPVKNSNDFSLFSEKTRLLVANVQTIKQLIKKAAENVIYRFKTITQTCDEIIENANKLKTLMAI